MSYWARRHTTSHHSFSKKRTKAKSCKTVKKKVVNFFTTTFYSKNYEDHTPQIREHSCDAKLSPNLIAERNKKENSNFWKVTAIVNKITEEAVAVFWKFILYIYELNKSFYLLYWRHFLSKFHTNFSEIQFSFVFTVTRRSRCSCMSAVVMTSWRTNYRIIQ